MQLFYAALAVVGLFVTWVFNLRFMAEGGGGFDVMAFVAAAYANAASTSLANDLFVGVAAFLAWSYTEARRLEMRGWWLYPLVTLGVAFAVAFPLFLLMRERRLQEK